MAGLIDEATGKIVLENLCLVYCLIKAMSSYGKLPSIQKNYNGADQGVTLVKSENY